MNRYKILAFIILPITLFITSCSAQRMLGVRSVGSSGAVAPTAMMDSYSESANVAVYNNNNESPYNNTLEENTTEKKIERVANIKFEVDDFDIANKKISTLAESIKDVEVYSENEKTIGDRITKTIVFKVPPKDFTYLINGILESSIYTDEKNIFSHDKTMEYVDINARMKAKQKLEDRYYDLLARAETIDQIISLEQQINNLRQEIDSQQAQLNAINLVTKKNTIHLTFYKKLSYKETQRIYFLDNIRQSFWNGWNGFLIFIIGFVSVWPAIILIPLVIFIMNKIYSFIRK